MKQTLLEMVQDILLELNSFPVNSISDTVESEQVAAVVRRTYYDILAQRDWAHVRKAMQLDAATADLPTHLSVPDGVKKVERIMYDVRGAADDKLKYQEMTYLVPEQFLGMQNGLDSTASNVDTVADPGGISLLVRNDKQPQYWTSFDDAYIVLDSYKSSLDSYLQNSKTQALVVVTPSWDHDDDFYPSLPEEAFPYLLAESTSRACMALRGVVHEKAEQASNRLRRILSQKHWTLNSGDRTPNYGRTVGRSKNPYLEK
jgi:hypothetical protein